MSLFDDLLAAMITTDPGARHAIRQAGRAQDAQQATMEELAALRREVAALQRVVAALAHAVAEGVTEDGDELRERLLAVVDGASTGDPTADSLARCASCGALLDPAEPPLTLRKLGRVCSTCFDRGGAG
jgi:hypothetical protein